MKIALAGIAALLLAIVVAPGPAAAQGVPQGSYLGSCNGVAVRGNVLVATCRRRGPGELRTALTGFPRCVGDIGNNDGVLQCMFPNGRQARGQLVAEPGYRPPPPPPYAAPPPYREAERCRELRGRSHELRERMERAFDPISRGRIEARLREVYSQQWYAGCRYEQ
jgi:hypothetical protein